MYICGWITLLTAEINTAIYAQSYPTLRPLGLQPARLLCPWDSAGRNTGVGCHFLLQEIFPAQGSNLHLLLGRQTVYH